MIGNVDGELLRNCYWVANGTACFMAEMQLHRAGGSSKATWLRGNYCQRLRYVDFEDVVRKDCG
jgi:hypothetical protein